MPKIAFCTMWGDSYKDLYNLTIPVMMDYCDKHGYSLCELYLGENDNNYQYKKHEFFKKLFDACFDLVFYLDCDCLITNFNCKVEDFVDDEHDYYLAKDYTELNNGVCIIKNTKGGRELNDFILEERNNFGNEQNILVYYYEQLKSQIKVLPQHTINAYKYEIYPEIGKLTKEQGQWEEGCFILHTPGASMPTRIETLKNTPIIK